MAKPQFTELAHIPVRIGPPRAEGALVPLSHGGSDGVMLGSGLPAGTPSPIGVNVDSLVILDALADGTIFDVEVLMPMRGWRSGHIPTPPSTPEAGSICIADPGPSIYVAATPRFTIDTDRQLHIEFEVTEGQTRWVALSLEVLALVKGHSLAGLLVRLTR